MIFNILNFTWLKLSRKIYQSHPSNIKYSIPFVISFNIPTMLCYQTHFFLSFWYLTFWLSYWNTTRRLTFIKNSTPLNLLIYRLTNVNGTWFTSFLSFFFILSFNLCTKLTIRSNYFQFIFFRMFSNQRNFFWDHTVDVPKYWRFLFLLKYFLEM